MIHQACDLSVFGYHVYALWLSYFQRLLYNFCFKYFDFGPTWWWLFQKRIVWTKLDIYGFTICSSKTIWSLFSEQVPRCTVGHFIECPFYWKTKHFHTSGFQVKSVRLDNIPSIACLRLYNWIENCYTWAIWSFQVYIYSWQDHSYVVTIKNLD
jgi:hypothetical protein